MSADLTDFLLARIKEDEARATTEATLRDGDPYYVTEASSFERHFDPARVLAECQAKRRAVGVVRRSFGLAQETMAALVLSSLAAVYADHPDYRQEWRA
jgi:hypothetical protein